MDPLDKARKSGSFCIYPWVHQYVGPPGDVKPCCVYQQDQELGSLKEHSLEEIWNNEQTRKLRMDLLNGQEPSGCKICWERKGMVTHRDQANQSLAGPDVHDIIASTQEDGSVPEHKLLYLDARWNNLCNLKCRTCGPRFSTTWIEDHAKLYNRSMDLIKSDGDGYQFSGKTENQLLEEIMPHLPHVKQIYFAGGEPLMQNEHYAVLEELVRRQHTGTHSRPLVINYNTNFTKLKLGRHDAIEYWKLFKNIKINASLDGNHARAEYWRKGTKWDTVVKNRERMMAECPDIEFRISFTLSWPNSYNLVDFHREWTELGLISPGHLALNILEVPVHLSIKHIPTWKKDVIRDLFLDQIEWLKQYPYTDHVQEEYKNAITIMYSMDTGSDFLYKESFEYTQGKLDCIRDENFWETFPEHHDIRNRIFKKSWPS